MVRDLKPDFYLNLADEKSFLSYSRDPGRLRREIMALPNPGLIAIDEVQRIPKLLNTIQVIIDEDRSHRFILTGSSARKLRRGGANLLPGRVILEHLDPLTVTELGDHFNLERALRLGTLPGIYLGEAAEEDLLETYATVYLREEIQAEALTREIGSYARFLDVAAEMSGQWINYTKVSSDTEIPKETIRRFFSILEETLVAFRIPSYQPKRSKRRVSQRDRFVLFDIGVRNALLGLHKHPVSPTERGLLFEQWLLLQCLYFQRAHRRPWQISTYRTNAGAEVDIIIDTGEDLLAIECKSSEKVLGIDLRGFRSFDEVAKRPVKRYVVYQGEMRQRLAPKTLAIPYREFLTEELARF